jgi:hypothetical protein
MHKAAVLLTTGIIFLIACVEKPPSRDEIPLIKSMIGRFQTAVKEKDIAAIDSLMISEALELGYNSGRVLRDVYGDSLDGAFYGFGRKDITYVDKKGLIKCLIVTDSTANDGKPVEITIIKGPDRWLIKRFDLK